MMSLRLRRSARWIPPALVTALASVVTGGIPVMGGTPARIVAAVVRVIDGDTIEVTIDGRQKTVQLIGVRTPETVHPTIGVEPFGPEASAFTKGLLSPGTEVQLELDVQKRDQYGRLLACLYLPDGRMLNAELVRAALEQLLTVPPNVRYVGLFTRLQREAREARRGLTRFGSSDPGRPRPWRKTFGCTQDACRIGFESSQFIGQRRVEAILREDSER